MGIAAQSVEPGIAQNAGVSACCAWPARLGWHVARGGQVGFTALIVAVLGFLSASGCTRAETAGAGPGDRPELDADGISSGDPAPSAFGGTTTRTGLISIGPASESRRITGRVALASDLTSSFEPGEIYVIVNRAVEGEGVEPIGGSLPKRGALWRVPVSTSGEFEFELPTGVDRIAVSAAGPGLAAVRDHVASLGDSVFIRAYYVYAARFLFKDSDTGTPVFSEGVTQLGHASHWSLQSGKSHTVWSQMALRALGVMDSPAWPRHPNIVLFASSEGVSAGAEVKFVARAPGYVESVWTGKVPLLNDGLATQDVELARDIHHWSEVELSTQRGEDWQQVRTYGYVSLARVILGPPGSQEFPFQVEGTDLRPGSAVRPRGDTSAGTGHLGVMSRLGKA